MFKCMCMFKERCGLGRNPYPAVSAARSPMTLRPDFSR